MNDELTHLDLCSGIGGFTLAAGRAGFRTIGFSEIDAYACRVLAARFPGIRNYGDIRRTAEFARLRGAVRIITAGYPCQPVSLAGKRRGQEDDRWLWPAVRAVLKLLRPAWFIGENTFGHVSLGLDEVLTDLENIGYSAQSFVIPTCAVGSWHRRDRVWIVAHFDGLGELEREGNEREVGGRPEHEDQGAVADALGGGQQGRDLQKAARRPKSAESYADIVLPGRLQGAAPTGLHSADEAGRTWHEYFAGLSEWPAEPPLVRVVHGIPHRAH